MQRFTTAALAGVLAAGLTALQAQAAGTTVELGMDVPAAAKERVWTVGLGAAAAPDYEGSEDMTVVSIPVVKLVDPSGWFVELLGNTLRANVAEHNGFVDMFEGGWDFAPDATDFYPLDPDGNCWNSWHHNQYGFGYAPPGCMGPPMMLDEDDVCALDDDD